MATRRALKFQRLSAAAQALNAVPAIRSRAVSAVLSTGHAGSSVLASRPVKRSSSSLISATRRAYSTAAEEQAKNEGEEDLNKEPEEKLLSETETVSGPVEHHTFKAETKRLLDIVAHSLYTDREVFIRELASNASDACEKLRYLALSDPSALEEGADAQSLGIDISVDRAKGTMIIQDSGIGMTLEELNDNLGTIARSGTKAFVERLEGSGDKTAKENLIGQFGVGFYSALMVADKIKVYTRSARKGSKGYCWSTDGSGSYDVAEADGGWWKNQLISS